MTLASYSASSTGATSASQAMWKMLPSNYLGLQTESAVSPSKSHRQETLMIPEDLLVQDDSSIGATSFSRQQCVPWGFFCPSLQMGTADRTPLFLSLEPIQLASSGSPAVLPHWVNGRQETDTAPVASGLWITGSHHQAPHPWIQSLLGRGRW